MSLRSQVVMKHSRSQDFFTNREYRAYGLRTFEAGNPRKPGAGFGESLARRSESSIPRPMKASAFALFRNLARPMPPTISMAHLVRFFRRCWLPRVALACMNVANIQLVRATVRQRRWR
jgi:hypothetical protein